MRGTGIPNYLVADLVKSKKEERAEQEKDSALWKRVEIAGIPVIVRTAFRRTKKNDRRTS